MKKEGHWTYSAPDVPISHWIDQGHDEEYAVEAEYLVQSIKDTTRNLRADDGGKVQVVCGFPILSDNAIDPHWEQLASAMQLSERITELYFRNVQLEQSTLQMIEASVRQKGISRFSLYQNQFHEGDGDCTICH